MVKSLPENPGELARMQMKKDSGIQNRRKRKKLHALQFSLSYIVEIRSALSIMVCRYNESSLE